MTSKELAKLAVKALDDKKGEDIKIIEIENNFIKNQKSYQH